MKTYGLESSIMQKNGDVYIFRPFSAQRLKSSFFASFTQFVSIEYFHSVQFNLKEEKEENTEKINKFQQQQHTFIPSSPGGPCAKQIQRENPFKYRHKNKEQQITGKKRNRKENKK